jgi:23S rRNA (uracil1939-C5)-methyltransferase
MLPVSVIDLHVERAVPGGRMLARHDGVVVLVAGAIPGERVRAVVEKATRSVIWARVVEVIEPHPGRRPAGDPACGGMDYAHLAYADQLTCKRDVIVDAFRRIGRMAVPHDVPVEPSPELGYRLRARLHVADGRAGFYREGSHVLCDAVATGQILPESVAAVERVIARIGRRASDVDSAVVAENVRASQRVVHLEGRPGTRLDDVELTDAALGPDVAGVTTFGHGHVMGLAGTSHVTDSAEDLLGAAPPIPAETTWVRQAASFFQGNRFLTGTLVRHVLSLATGDRAADFYAGVGLFSVALAAAGRRVVAVEGDRTSGRDLATNAEPFGDRLRVVRRSVEEAATDAAPASFDVLVLDPPRAGVSAAALTSVIRIGAPRIVYVSCDPATLARDSAKLGTAGYVLTSLRAFDFFPNTAHVETVALFVQSRGGQAAVPGGR